jgi:hypothetical protein
MALVRRLQKLQPVSAAEYDAVVDQVEVNQGDIQVIAGQFADSQVTLSFADLATATAYWTAQDGASNTPTDNVEIYIKDVKQFFKWNAADAAKAVFSRDSRIVDYVKYQKYTTANKNLIDVSDTTVTYVVFDSDLNRLEIYKDGAWGPVSDEEALALKLNKSDIVTIAGKNLFDKTSFREGFYRSDTGVFDSRANSKASNLIPVTESTDYYLSGRDSTDAFAKHVIVFFNSSSTIISFLNTFQNGTFTTPANTAFVAFNIYADNLGTDTNVQLELGQVATTYEPYKKFTKTILSNNIGTEYIYDSISNKFILLSDYLDAKNYAIVTLKDTILSKNLFDKTSFREGFYRSDTGVFNSRPNSKASNLIPVTESTNYYLSGRDSTDSFAKYVVVFFDSSSTIISFLNNFLNGSFRTPANTAFVAFNVYADNLGTDTNVQLELGQVATTYESYQTLKTINTLNNETIYYERDKILGDELYPYPSRLNGKKVAWFGTSIPAGGGRFDGGTAITSESYPNIACAKLGATIANESQSSSLIRIANSDGSPVYSQFTNVIFGRTIAEATIAGIGIDQSYETKVFNHLDADVFVFNFDYNDYSTDATDFDIMPADPFNRNTFIGSHNYVISKLLEKNPKARIIIFGFYENQSGRGKKIQTAHQLIADYWQIPYFKTFEKTGFSQKLITKEGDGVAKTELVQWMPDGVHPASDPTGDTTKLLARLAEICLETCF